MSVSGLYPLHWPLAGLQRSTGNHLSSVICRSRPSRVHHTWYLSCFRDLAPTGISTPHKRGPTFHLAIELLTIVRIFLSSRSLDALAGAYCHVHGYRLFKRSSNLSISIRVMWGGGFVDVTRCQPLSTLKDRFRSAPWALTLSHPRLLVRWLAYGTNHRERRGSIFFSFSSFFIVWSGSSGSLEISWG